MRIHFIGTYKKSSNEELFDIGALGTIRTCDLQIRSLMLYPAELRAQVNNVHRTIADFVNTKAA
jgi:hypothetical protein